MQPIVAVGRNCWRIERATEARMIVDAADYYHIIAEAMQRAKERIFIVGWDFDTRISLAPDREGSYHSSLGHFFLELAREKPERQIDILKWNFGALKQFLSIRATYWLFRWWIAKPINLKFDSSHPKGCSHHQKIVVIDESLAACGGIDIAMRRWDTRDHKPDDECRTTPNGKPYDPWHDVTMLLRGDIAGALGDLGRERWKVATTADLDPVREAEDDWPEDLDPHFKDVDVAIARTRAEYDDVEEVRENEALVIDMIEKCERFAYIENQYFTSPKIAAAICTRLSADDPPEIVLVMPRTADGWLEAVAMDGTRQKLMQTIQNSPGGENFRIYVPVNAAGTDIYVHAKVAVIDDRFLRVGSANLNNRSMGLDSECDVIVDCGLPQNAGRGFEKTITDLRRDLMAEHLGVDLEAVEQAEADNRGLIATIEALRGQDKTLSPLAIEELSGAENFIAEHELGDPESTDDMFEPMSRKSLRQRWRETRTSFRRRFRSS
ncbi:phospholipase D-like domain-containing protein [Sphingomicrobium arenosum]|uniref:phospholipase D-like domain-containing protein n=1 Tax=Sphingomicrobium arenosum TaxID=2233861 RepID=UPI00224039A2|nr:phospholipase D-like domain-containing protein [Sphingomicrobium arenosum]